MWKVKWITREDDDTGYEHIIAVRLYHHSGYQWLLQMSETDFRMIRRPGKYHDEHEEVTNNESDARTLFEEKLEEMY